MIGIFAWVRVGLYWLVHSLHSLFGGCARWSFLWFGYGHWYEGCVCHYGAVVDSFTIPLAKNVKQTHFRERSAQLFKTTFSQFGEHR